MSNVNLLERAIRPAISFFEDPIGLERTLWRDYSKHQGFVNHGIASLNGVVGMFARSTISWGYQDAMFPHNWIESKENGLYRTSYHVPYPKEPAVKQLDNWYRVHPEIDTIPRVVDMELEHGASPGQIADVIWLFSEIVLARDGVRPIIYSRKNLIDKWLIGWSESDLNAHKWWLAQYLWDRMREHPGPPTLPNRIRRENVIMHQTADKKKGFPGEAESNAVDYDRWEIGNEAQMHQYIADTWGGGVVTPPQPPVVEPPCVPIDIIGDSSMEVKNIQITFGSK